MENLTGKTDKRKQAEEETRETKFCQKTLNWNFDRKIDLEYAAAISRILANRRKKKKN